MDRFDQAPSAREFAVTAHGDQKYGDEPYSVHLDEVAELVARGVALSGVDEDTAVAAAYLHDVVEDTAVEIEEVHVIFGYDVALAVALVTDPSEESRKEKKAVIMTRLAGATVSPQGNRIGLLVKMADRLANVKACVRSGDSRLKMYRKEHAVFKASVYRQEVGGVLKEELDSLMDQGVGTSPMSMSDNPPPSYVPYPTLKTDVTATATPGASEVLVKRMVSLVKRHDGVVCARAWNSYPVRQGELAVHPTSILVGPDSDEHERWPGIIRQATACMDRADDLGLLAGKSVLVSHVGEYAVIVSHNGNWTVGVVYLKGHPISKSLRRMLRRILVGFNMPHKLPSGGLA